MSTIKIQINGEEVESLDQAIKLIKEAKEQEKKGLWRPEKGERYSFLSSDGVDSVTWYEDSCDCSRLDRGIFKTEEEAIDADNKRKALTRIKDYIAREGIEREKDWFDGDTFYSLIRIWGFSAEDTEKIIQACESDLKILFGPRPCPAVMWESK